MLRRSIGERVNFACGIGHTRSWRTPTRAGAERSRRGGASPIVAGARLPAHARRLEAAYPTESIPRHSTVGAGDGRRRARRDPDADAGPVVVRLARELGVAASAGAAG